MFKGMIEKNDNKAVREACSQSYYYIAVNMLITINLRVITNE